MSRSIWKPVYQDKNFETVLASEKESPFCSRALLFTEELLGQNLFVHNGRRYSALTVELEHLHHRAGEFVSTRVKPKTIRKKNIKKKW
jgi:ribosomal protein S19